MSWGISQRYRAIDRRYRHDAACATKLLKQLCFCEGDRAGKEPENALEGSVDGLLKGRRRSTGGMAKQQMLAIKRQIHLTSKLANFSARFAKTNRCNRVRVKVMCIKPVIGGWIIAANAAYVIASSHFYDELGVRRIMWSTGFECAEPVLTVRRVINWHFHPSEKVAPPPSG
jgi:hypothetical protein